MPKSNCRLILYSVPYQLEIQNLQLKPINSTETPMGNQSLNQQIQNQISQLKVLKKQSHYSILQAPDQTEYIRFLYTPIYDQSQTTSGKSRKISIFDQKYLEYRWQQQQNHNQISALPKILAFGEDSQTQSIISCTRNKLNFVIFQHPTLSLKQQIEKRISSNHPFKQSELVTLIKSVLSTLLELYDHSAKWNSENTHKNAFLATEDNIYLNNKGQFILSDIAGHFNEIQHLSKHQVTLKRQSRANSLTNLHAKMTTKKMKTNYFQSNLQNLASIIQGIIFKFSQFNQTCKNTQQSSSLSTALSTYRSATKGSLSFSLDFQQLLKDLKQQYQNPEIIIEKADKILDAIHLPTPIERSQEICFKNQIEENTPNQSINLIDKIPQTLNVVNLQERIPLQELKNSNQYSLHLKFDHLLQQKQQTQQLSSKKHTDSRFMKIKTDQTLHFTNIQLFDPKQVKQAQKRNTKIRLSLKKTDDSGNSTHRKQNFSYGKPVQKIQHTKSFALLKKNNETALKGKQNLLTLSKGSKQQQEGYKKGANRSSCQKKLQKIMKVKLLNPWNSQHTSYSSDKQKVMLKKQTTQKQTPTANPSQQPELTTHLNPMSRKKTFKTTNRPHYSISIDKTQKNQVYRTNLKAQDLAIDCIENLSSIVSNQNNTISSYGIPTTEEFKTEDSMIEVEGCVEFCDGDDSYALMQERVQKQIYIESTNNQSSKKPISKPSITSCVKLSTYQSLSQQSYERSQQRIPEFLKQFKLPEKNLMTLNNHILKQKNVIVEESFEQSQLNSIRHSYPNVLSFQYC